MPKFDSATVENNVVDVSVKVNNPPKNNALGRCTDCNIAFCYRSRAKVDRHKVICPLCSMHLEVTTRRLRAGFVPLSDSQVDAIVDRSYFTPAQQSIIALAESLIAGEVEAWKQWDSSHTEIRDIKIKPFGKQWYYNENACKISRELQAQRDQRYLDYFNEKARICREQRSGVMRHA